MIYIDTHCHLNFSQYHSDMEEVIARAFEADVAKLINIGTDLKTSRESVNLASRYQNIFASVGVHPHDARNVSTDTISQLAVLAKDRKVVAIGEIGLDYYRNLSSKEAQKRVFAKQLELALKLKQPVVIHCRDAYKDVLDILDEVYMPGLGDQLPGVIHSFSSGINYLQEFLKRGFYIGFNGMITYPNNSKLIEAVKATPNERILIETDAPYLSPQAYRGNRNEPMWIIETAKTISQVKEISLEEVANITTNNAMCLFRLK